MEGGSEPSRYVEVRICYRFTTLINIDDMQLPFAWDISVGEVYLQKDRVFTVGWYPPRPTPSPPPAPTPPPPTAAPTDVTEPHTVRVADGHAGADRRADSDTPVATPSPTPCPPPVASFTATPTSGKKPLNVNFLNTSTSGCAITDVQLELRRRHDIAGPEPDTHLHDPAERHVVYTVTLHGHEPERHERAGHRDDHGDEVSWPRREVGSRGQSLVEFALVAPLLFL